MIHYKGRRILVMGLGLNGGGLGVVRWLTRHGYPSLVTDLKDRAALRETLRQMPKSPLISYRLGGHDENDFRLADVVIQNPGVPSDSPFLRIAERHGALIINEATMFFDRCPSTIVAVTGTRGKSTTCWFIHQILNSAKRSNVLTGNIARSSMMDVLDGLKETDIAVVELSSWHLDKFFLFPFAPDIAVLTNIYKDHLNRYKNFREYIKAKSAITLFQNHDQIFITNPHNVHCALISARTKAKVALVRQLPRKFSRNFKLAGPHNAYNLALAIETAKKLGVSDADIQRALPDISPLQYRQQSEGFINNHEMINDSTATSPDAVIAAITTFLDKPIVLIAGGVDKELEFNKLAFAIKRHVSSVVLLPGNASVALANRLSKLHYANVHRVHSLADAISSALKIAPNFGRIVFSPGAASFNLFKNEFDRARQFSLLVKRIRGKKK